MYIQDIAKVLKVKCLIGSLCSDISMVQMPYGFPEEAASQHLFIIRLSSLLNFPPKGKFNLACIMDIPCETDKLKTLECNMLLLPDSLSEAAAFNSIQEILDEEYKFITDYARLKEAIIEGQSTQQFIDLCSEILGNAVVFSGKDTKLIAHSKRHQGKSTLWEEYGNQGRFSEAIIQSSNYKIMQKKLLNATSPIILKKMIGDYTTITGKIEIDNFQVGYFSVLDTEKAVTKADKKMVAAICSLLTYYLKDNTFNGNDELLKKNRNIQLLLDGGKGHNWFESHSGIADLHLDEGYNVMVLQQEKRKDSIAALLNWIVKLLPDHAIAEYDKNIVVIINSGNQVSADKMDKFLKEHELYCGISYQSNTADKFRECYDSALKAIKIGILMGEKKSQFYYGDYAVYHLWHTLSECMDLTQYYHPAIPCLLEYDKTHRTEFTKTLHVFLECNGNISSTAGKLDIHRASLVYRIEKLQELLKINLDDGNTRNYLYGSFQIQRILEGKRI